jgi:endonuclease/exonuclease/phosphatase family metal-dependent hydrolase
MNTHIDYRGEDTERLMNVEEIKNASVAALVKARTFSTAPQSANSHWRLQTSERLQSPTIICGDFNALPGSRTHARMKDQFRDAWEEAGIGDGFTFPSTEPVRRIDYIWLSQHDSLHPLKLWVPETEASDHLPVVAEIELR